METQVRETSGRLFEIIEDEMMFKPYTNVNGMYGRWMQIEHSSDDEDGTYPRVSDYVRLTNKMSDDGTSAWLTWIGKGRLTIDMGDYTIIRESKYSDKARLIFKNPITVVFGIVGEEMVTRDVSLIHGEFSHEWFWSKRGRQNKVANGYEIYFDCQKFE